MQPAKTEAWPFLIGRDRKKGYQVIVAPLPLLRASIYGFLATELQLEKGDARGTVYSQTIVDKDNSQGIFTLVYRGIHATPEITGDAEIAANDRRDTLIEGIMIRDPTDFVLSQTGLDELHTSLSTSMRTFLTNSQLIPSSSISLSTSGSAVPIKIVTPYEYPALPALDWSTETIFQPQSPIQKLAATLKKVSDPEEIKISETAVTTLPANSGLLVLGMLSVVTFFLVLLLIISQIAKH